MRLVVTGATGNVGTSLIAQLAADPRTGAVVGIARRAPAWTPPGVEWRERDVGRDDLTADLAGADALVHLAWQIQPSWDHVQLWRTNVVGSARTWQAALAAGVRTIVHASSIGAYSPRQGDAPVDEGYPTHGVATSPYSWQKAMVERQLDAVEAAHPDVRVVRLRPGLIFKRPAGSEIRSYFLGGLVPRRLLRPGALPVLPRGGGIRFQAVHADDVADAFVRALHADGLRGALNVADDEVLDLAAIADATGARTVPVPGRVLRGLAAATHAARLQPTDAGWVDLARQVPVMDTGRVRRELGWAPRVRALDALVELLHGIADGATGPTPSTDPAAPSARAAAATGSATGTGGVPAGVVG